MDIKWMFTAMNRVTKILCPTTLSDAYSPIHMVRFGSEQQTDWRTMTIAPILSNHFFKIAKMKTLFLAIIFLLSKKMSMAFYGLVPMTGLCSFDIKNKRFKRFLHDDHSNSISSNFIRDIEFAPDGSMWISTGKGLNRLDLSTMRFTSFFHDPNDSTTLSGNTLTKMAIDKNGNLWVSVNETIFLECFNTKTYRVKHFTNFTEKESHVPANSPRDIFIDRSGRLWVGTDSSRLASLFTWQKYFLSIQS